MPQHDQNGSIFGPSGRPQAPPNQTTIVPAVAAAIPPRSLPTMAVIRANRRRAPANQPYVARPAVMAISPRKLSTMAAIRACRRRAPANQCSVAPPAVTTIPPRRLPTMTTFRIIPHQIPVNPLKTSQNYSAATRPSIIGRQQMTPPPQRRRANRARTVAATSGPAPIAPRPESSIRSTLLPKMAANRVPPHQESVAQRHSAASGPSTITVRGQQMATASQNGVATTNLALEPRASFSPEQLKIIDGFCEAKNRKNAAASRPTSSRPKEIRKDGVQIKEPGIKEPKIKEEPMD